MDTQYLAMNSSSIISRLSFILLLTVCPLFAQYDIPVNAATVNIPQDDHSNKHSEKQVHETRHHKVEQPPSVRYQDECDESIPNSQMHESISHRKQHHRHESCCDTDNAGMIISALVFFVIMMSMICAVVVSLMLLNQNPNPGWWD